MEGARVRLVERDRLAHADRAVVGDLEDERVALLEGERLAHRRRDRGLVLAGQLAHRAGRHGQPPPSRSVRHALLPYHAPRRHRWGRSALDGSACRLVCLRRTAHGAVTLDQQMGDTA